MGKLVLGHPSVAIELDDRTLAHLRSVMLTKLRRDEKFAFSYQPTVAGSGSCTIWVHPSASVQFHFDGDGNQRLNPAWIGELSNLASSGSGLRLTDEPSAP